MPYYSYNVSTGSLIETSESLLHDGSPPSNVAVSFTNIPQEELDLNYVWDQEDRDFKLK